MRQIWVSAIAVVAILVVAIVWVGSSRKRKIPEPAAAPAVVGNKAVPVKRIARQKAEGCTPLAGGGFSCGACRDDTDCPEKSGCIVNLATGKTECQQSDCTKHEDCGKDNYCRVVARTPGGVAIRACVPPGTRSAGAACDPDDATNPAVSCAGNMVCINGGCSPPCEPTPVPKDSPECGYLGCIGTDNGYGCTPSCKQYPCEGGKSCEFLSTRSPISLCTHVVGENCLGPEGGCTASQECLVETNTREERTTFRCVERCDVGNADNACGKDAVCVLHRQQGKVGGLCRRRCSQEGDPVCGSGERCKRDDVGVWFCSAA